MNTLAHSLKEYAPAIALTQVVSRRTMHILRTTFLTIALLTGAAASVSHLFFAGQLFLPLVGVACITLALWLEQMLTIAFHNSFYFRKLDSVIQHLPETVTGATYDVAEVAYGKKDDIAKAFCTSHLGSLSLLRAGIPAEAVNTYLDSDRQKISASHVQLPQDEVFSVIGLAKYLLTYDPAFSQMITTAGIQSEIFLGAVRWVVGSQHTTKRRARWWSKDNLSQRSSIGSEWAYGRAHLLEKFSRSINTSAVFSTLTTNSPFAVEKITQIETSLARSKAANVLLIGEPGVGKMDLVVELKRRLATKKSLNAIAGKKIVVLDTTRLFAVQKSAQSLEQTLLGLLDQATLAGNSIIVIENLSSFIREAEGMGVFVPEIFDQYLSLPQLQFIATDTPEAYHTHLETLGAFTRRWAEVLIDTPDKSATTRVLQGIALFQEAKHHILFTYGGLEAISTAADRYVTEGVLPDKAITLLIDIAQTAHQKNIHTITADVVYTLVSEKTGIPAGPIDDKERETLLHLEDTLHLQVVGQERALSAIARTMRRARAGIQSAEKPIGSFLFLGPTGVGKTETAKALANVFFGSETKLERIDMSEFSGAGAVEKLIGSTQQVGVLPTLLREHPYSVLLLDEFEKASQPVHDIFLQVLDEGVFTDGKGTKTNARNTIIIATSNAGSKLILNTVQQRKDFDHLTSELIDHIVKQGIYRPELINRFDSTIIFEPLTKSEQTSVAQLLLADLYTRVKEQGYTLLVSDELLALLVEKGYHPEYGARPLQRILQDVIEEKVAQKIIAGQVQKGETISLTVEDFSVEELSV